MVPYIVGDLLLTLKRTSCFMKIFTIDLNFLGTTDTIACFLLDVDGELALVETGPDSTFSYLCMQISKLGYQVNEIKKVFVTHIHLDHAGAAWRFAAMGAQIYLHLAGVVHLANPEKLYRSAQRIYLEDMGRLWGRLEPIPTEQLIMVQDLESLPLGNAQIQALHTPGHAVHHIAWLIEENLFCGDVAGVKINGGPVVPPCPPPDIDIEAWMSSIQKMENCTATRLHLTHFGVVEDKLPHLKKLASVLNNWKDWMRPFAVSETPENEVTKLFVQYCEDFYRSCGLDETQTLTYEHANPAFMSVAGLLRYWKVAGLTRG